MDEYDLVAIGGGSGGYSAAIRAAQNGLTAAVIEREKVGGTCLHRGCIPTKVWLETADVLHKARKAGTYGVSLDAPSLDFAAMVRRQHDVVGTIHDNLRSVILKRKIEIIEGEATLRSPSEVQAGDRVISAKNVVLATGSRPKQIPGLETDGERVLTSDDLLELDVPPKSIAIIGAGAIGCEFASFFLDIGSDVTLIEMMERLLPAEDAGAARTLAQSFESRGATIMTSAKVLPEKTQKYDGVVELALEHEGEAKQMKAAAVLVAVGREAVTEGLGLENTSVRTKDGWIETSEDYRTAEPTIFAVGDAIGGLLLAHVAAAEGLIAGEIVAGKDPQPLDYGRVPRVTYSRPQVASVGMTVEEAREAGHDAKSKKFSYRYNAMALIHDEPEGFAKVIYDGESGDLLGAHIVGYNASEVISEAVLARYLQGSTWEIGSSIHAHPTVSEVLSEAAQLSSGISIYW